MVSKRPKVSGRVCSREGCQEVAKVGRWYCVGCVRENDRVNGRKRRRELRELRALVRRVGLSLSNAVATPSYARLAQEGPARGPRVAR